MANESQMPPVPRAIADAGAYIDGLGIALKYKRANGTLTLEYYYEVCKKIGQLKKPNQKKGNP